MYTLAEKGAWIKDTAILGCRAIHVPCIYLLQNAMADILEG